MPTKTGQGQTSPKLDFCILGAPNSGKSGLAAYLRTHPQVFMPELEPNLYADDINPAEYEMSRNAKNRQAYYDLFAGAVEGQLLGETSVLYLFSERAVPNILTDSPHDRFIVFLRNPVDVAHSIHSHLFRILYEDERLFEKAWELQETRAVGRRIPPFCKEAKLLLYRTRCSFAGEINRLFQRVPRERVLVHIFEEFFGDPKAGYERTLAFLGLPPDGQRHFERVQEHAMPRSRVLHRLASYPPFPFNYFHSPLKRAFNAFGLRPGLAFLRWTIGNGKEKLAPMDAAFRRRLQAEFRPEVARLEAILGRNLDVWASEDIV